jgi:26S proteasome regulatory subunit T1
MPSATGQSWEKYKKEYVDDEEPEKKITPLTDEYVLANILGARLYTAPLMLIQSSSGIYKC